MLTLAEQKQIANALIDAEKKVEQRIHEMRRLSEQIEYYRGRVDAIKMIQKTVSGEQDLDRLLFSAGVHRCTSTEYQAANYRAHLHPTAKADHREAVASLDFYWY